MPTPTTIPITAADQAALAAALATYTAILGPVPTTPPSTGDILNLGARVQWQLADLLARVGDALLAG